MRCTRGGAQQPKGYPMNLRDRIRATLAATRGPIHPEKVAARVVKAIPSEDRDAALAEALGHMVRDVITATRPSTPAPAPGTRSWKRDAIRDQAKARRSELDALYATEDGYKPLRSFSYDEMVALADRLQTLAEQNATQAVRFRRYADAMKAAGAPTLDALTPDALDALGVAA